MFACIMPTLVFTRESSLSTLSFSKFSPSIYTYSISPHLHLSPTPHYCGVAATTWNDFGLISANGRWREDEDLLLLLESTLNEKR